MNYYLIEFTRYVCIEGDHDYVQMIKLVKGDSFEHACEKIEEKFKRPCGSEYKVSLENFINHTIE